MAKHTVKTELKSIIKDMGKAHKLLRELSDLMSGFEDLTERDFDQINSSEANNDERATNESLRIIAEEIEADSIKGIFSNIEKLREATIAISHPAICHLISG